MVQDIKVSSSIKCIKAHLKTKYDQTQFKNYAIGITLVFRDKRANHNASDKET